MRKPLLSLAAVALVAAACGSAGSSSGGYVRPPDPQHHQPTHAATRCAGLAVRRRDLRGPRQQPDHRHRRGPRFDVRHGRRHRLVHDRPALRRRRQHARPRQHPGRGMGQRLRPGLRGARQGTFAIHVDGAPTPFIGQDQVLLRIGIKARESSERARPDAALTFVIDTSGSMAREDRLELVKDSLRKLVRALGRGDSIAVVAFGDNARVVLPPTRATDEETDPRRDRRAASRAARPTSRPASGSATGWPARRFSTTGIDRVILASDGVANVGLTDADSILREIRDDAAAGHRARLGRRRDGQLQRRPARAARRPGRRLLRLRQRPRRGPARCSPRTSTGTLQSVALDAKVQVEFDPDVVASYRLIGYENRAIADEDFRDPSVDAGAIGAGHAVTALYELTLREGSRGRTSRDGPAALDRTGSRARVVAAHRDIAASDLADRFGAADRPSGSMPSSRPRPRSCAAKAGRDLDLRDVLESPARRAGDLPETDQVHDFLDLLDEMARAARRNAAPAVRPARPRSNP